MAFTYKIKPLEWDSIQDTGSLECYIVAKFHSFDYVITKMKGEKYYLTKEVSGHIDVIGGNLKTVEEAKSLAEEDYIEEALKYLERV